MKKRLPALLVVIALLISCCQLAIASDVQPYASEYLSRYTVALGPGKNSGEVILAYSVLATDTMTQLGISKVEIYKSNGSYVTTIYGNSTNKLMGYSTEHHNGNYIYTGTSGVSYYAKVTVYAKDSTGSDYRTVTTATAKAP